MVSVMRDMRHWRAENGAVVTEPAALPVPSRRRRSRRANGACRASR